MAVDRALVDQAVAGEAVHQVPCQVVAAVQVVLRVAQEAVAVPAVEPLLSLALLVPAEGVAAVDRAEVALLLALSLVEARFLRSRVDLRDWPD